MKAIKASSLDDHRGQFKWIYFKSKQPWIGLAADIKKTPKFELAANMKYIVACNQLEEIGDGSSIA